MITFLRCLAVVALVLFIAGCGAGVIILGVTWIENPMAQCWVVGSGVLIIGAAEAVAAGSKVWLETL